MSDDKQAFDRMIDGVRKLIRHQIISKAPRRYVVDLAIWQSEDTVRDGESQFCELYSTQTLYAREAHRLLENVCNACMSYAPQMDKQDESFYEFSRFAVMLHESLQKIEIPD